MGAYIGPQGKRGTCSLVLRINSTLLGRERLTMLKRSRIWGLISSYTCGVHCQLFEVFNIGMGEFGSDFP